MFDDGLFDLFSEPVLLLRDGRIAACSAGARAMGLAVGADAPTLPDIPSGGASLELTLAGRPRTGTARPLEDGMLLLVQPEQTELLSAQTLLAVSHALQTPLEELFSAGETLVPVLEELEDSSLQHSTAVCQRALYRLLRLCGHLRDFGGGLSGELTLRREKAELCGYFGDLCEQLEPLCTELGVSLREKLPARQFYGWIDRKRLGSAICELLSNALKYTPCGGSILLELTRHEQNAVITIADSGEGMDGKTLAEAFSKFGRFAPLDDGRRGAGFGLPLVRQIIQLHGGTLLLQGREEGAAVSILLPLSAPDKEQLSLHSPVLVPEDGAPNAALIALADVLPPEVYDTRNL